MNIFKRTLEAVGLSKKALTMGAGTSKYLGGSTTSLSGVTVNEGTQFKIATAFSAIRLISETVGTLPLRLYRKTSKGREPAKDHPLYRLVSEQPNDYMTAPEWKEAMAVSLATQGQSYNYVRRFASTGRVVSIEPVARSSVTATREGGVLVYKMMMGADVLKLKRSDICPIRGFGGVGELEGYPVHAMLSESFALTKAVENYGAQFFGRGARPSGMLVTDKVLKDDQRKSIQDNFANHVNNELTNGRFPLVEAGITFESINSPNNEAQFIETRKMQVAEIARI